ncbi:MAG: choice-of-anchor P family protein [Limisphaerales bacterium]
MKKRQYIRRTVAASAAMAAGVWLLGLAAAKADTASPTYSGQATVIDVTHMHNSPDIIIADTGPLPPTGGNVEVSVGETNMFGLSLEMAEASTLGDGDTASSRASLDDLTIVFVTMETGVTNTITVDSIVSEAEARCQGNNVALSGSARIDGLVVNGQAIAVTGQPNQVVSFNGWTLTINEQTASSTSSDGSISVVALRIDDIACLQGVIGFSHADITCGNPTPGQCDMVTGGGWIVGTPSGAKGTFGVSGGIRRGAFWGHLNYIDHGTGTHVTSTAVTGDTIIDSVTRQLTYNVDIDGQPGTATVIVQDNGEPGRNDTFAITLSTGYSASGDLGGSQPGGGNIQIHKCPPGWQ